MAAGDYAIRRNAANTDSVPDVGSGDLLLLWDTAVASTGAGITYSAGTFTLGETGHFLVLCSDQCGTTDTTNNERFNWKTTLTLAGTELVEGYASGYIRKSSGSQEHITFSAAVINVATTTGNGDDLQVRSERIDNSTTGTCDRVADRSGVTIIKLDDTWDYGRYTGTATTSGTNDVAVSVLDATVEEDATFTRTTTNVDMATNNLVLAVYSAKTEDGTPTARSEFQFRVTQAAAAVPGSYSQTYVRTSDNCDWGGYSNVSLLDVTSGEDAALEVITRESGSTTSFDFAMQLVSLPAAAEAIIVEATTGGFNVATTNFAWDTNPYIDTAAFTHTATNANLDVDNAGDYLVMASQAVTTYTAVTRAVPAGGFRVNTTDDATAGTATYHRGTSNAGFGALSSATLLTGLAANDSVYFRNDRIGTVTGTLTNGSGGMSMIRLSSLFSEAADIAGVDTESVTDGTDDIGADTASSDTGTVASATDAVGAAVASTDTQAVADTATLAISVPITSSDTASVVDAGVPAAAVVAVDTPSVADPGVLTAPAIWTFPEAGTLLTWRQFGAPAVSDETNLYSNIEAGAALASLWIDVTSDIDVAGTDTASLSGEAASVAAAVTSSDTVSVAEAPIVAAAVGGVDTGTVADSADLDVAVVSSDTMSLSGEAASVAATLTSSDTVTVVEVPLVPVDADAVDTGTVAESTDLDAAAVSTDTATVADSVVVAVAVVSTDTATVTDTGALTTARPVTSSDTVALVDSSSVAAAVTSPDTVGADDSAGIAAAVATSDTATLADTGALSTGRVLTSSDSVALTDTASVAATLAGSDTASMVWTYANITLGTVTDSATVTDPGELLKSVPVAATDVASVTDATVAIDAAVAATDAPGASEATSVAVTLSSTDSVTVTEVPLVPVAADATDTATLTEDETTIDVDVAATDTAALTDTAQIGAATNATDTATVDDTTSQVAISYDITGADTVIWAEGDTVLVVSLDGIDTVSLASVGTLTEVFGVPQQGRSDGGFARVGTASGATTQIGAASGATTQVGTASGATSHVGTASGATTQIGSASGSHN